ncbi:MAG: hypothetical protein GXO60_02995 [Epsilonproteobacteria bacterium]|nr:hypothetical protein [Campylobacterota bacterium]
MNKIKTTKLLIASMLLTTLMGGVAMAKDTKDTKIAKGTTIGHYQKPGAPVDLTYKSTRVDVGEVADINISLSTTLKSGEMDVLLSLDDNLEPIGDSYDSVTFMLSPNQNNYDINLKVKGKKDGLYYIRLLIEVKGDNSPKMRALAVPVYIGDGQLKKRSSQKIMKAMSGENISISKAQETIEIIK